MVVPRDLAADGGATANMPPSRAIETFGHRCDRISCVLAAGHAKSRSGTIGRKCEQRAAFLYRHRSFYTMRTDARVRLRTPLEQCFNRRQIYDMMERAGLTDIRFSNGEPFWCVVGLRSPV